MDAPGYTIDLRTAQSCVHEFLIPAIEEARGNGEVKRLTQDRAARQDLAVQTEELLFELLALPPQQVDGYRLAIADSGKRAIEVMINSFCTGNPDQTVAVTTENYVGHNKWSAALAMDRLKQVPFRAPFDLDIGTSLTIGSEAALELAKGVIEGNAETLYLAWNSTSTGILERVEELVDFRNRTGSRTLILADASSLDILSRRWTAAGAATLPDAFFFSFRKHPAIPYDGPQDEIEQMKSSGAAVLFNERARQRAATVQAGPVYDLLLDGSAALIPEGDKHTVHLLRLNTLLRHMLADGGSALDRVEETRQVARQECLDALAEQGSLGRLGFSLLADPRAQSSTSYVVRVPAAIKAADLLKRLEQEAGIIISPALHPLANTKNHNIIRFGVYSANTRQEVHTMLQELQAVAGTMIAETTQ
jgi:aspartate aminotransferase-like enzyme